MVLVSVSLLISVHESERKITWYLMKGSLYKSFLQMCFKNAFLRKSLVPKVLFVISIITVAISGLHIQKENSYLKITATYWTENCQVKQPGTTTVFWFLPAFTCQIAPV